MAEKKSESLVERILGKIGLIRDERVAALRAQARRTINKYETLHQQLSSEIVTLREFRRSVEAGWREEDSERVRVLEQQLASAIEQVWLARDDERHHLQRLGVLVQPPGAAVGPGHTVHPITGEVVRRHDG